MIPVSMKLATLSFYTLFFIFLMFKIYVMFHSDQHFKEQYGFKNDYFFAVIFLSNKIRYSVYLKGKELKVISKFI